jgi:hypothetical protein
MVVKGTAAASAKSRRSGLRPTTRSSTRWNSLHSPHRLHMSYVDGYFAPQGEITIPTKRKALFVAHRRECYNQLL